jgi:HEPN domain-containing protein
VNGRKLAFDYLERAKKRQVVLDALLAEQAYADVVREAQEALELILKGVLWYVGIEPPKRHDVGPALRQTADRLPPAWQVALDDAVEMSRSLMEERSHACYGDEDDFTPASQMYTRNDAEKAKAAVNRFVLLFEQLVKDQADGS